MRAEVTPVRKSQEPFGLQESWWHTNCRRNTGKKNLIDQEIPALRRLRQWDYEFKSP